MTAGFFIYIFDVFQNIFTGLIQRVASISVDLARVATAVQKVSTVVR